MDRFVPQTKELNVFSPQTLFVSAGCHRLKTLNITWHFLKSNLKTDNKKDINFTLPSYRAKHFLMVKKSIIYNTKEIN